MPHLKLYFFLGDDPLAFALRRSPLPPEAGEVYTIQRMHGVPEHYVVLDCAPRGEDGYTVRVRPASTHVVLEEDETTPQLKAAQDVTAALLAAQRRIAELEREVRDLRLVAYSEGAAVPARPARPAERLRTDHDFAPAELSVRALNVLHNYGVKTVDDLLAVDLTSRDVLFWRNSGPKLRLQLGAAQALLRKCRAAASVVPSSE